MQNQNLFGGFDPNRNQFGNANYITNNTSGLFSNTGNDRRGNNEIGTNFGRLAQFNFAPAASRAAFNAGLEADYQKTITDILNRLQNRNYATLGQRASNRMQATFGQASRLADQQARAAGLGQGAQQGALSGLSSNMARSAAAAEESYLDPRRRDADLMQAVQVLAQAMQSNPYLEQMLSMFAPVEQRHQANAAERQQGGALGGVLGNVLGQYIGGGGLSASRLKFRKQEIR